ncbi:DUF58 domain-containing protein [Microvirga lotononidis]|uniref:DUF58 domain-containing protein n=1 Tax=Microvirga lotononidis TaxID=864069 RepID=I4YN34_9HYPH|nr:DUF58 domain-containing protein [Microvirga lotononidis]EIM25376.1 hypothetical protein MicloDRAFT_00061020 [Microvirga lotononidis]WQO27325.1 DUF58 domain-containing protein [Microvirga lotononidis]
MASGGSSHHPPASHGRTSVTVDELLRLRHKARGFSFLPRQPVHSILTGPHASRLRGRGLNFEELRPYYPGDDTRTIDWNATARLREPFIRVYTEERDRAVMLLVDQRLSMFFGSHRATKSVAAAEVAAASAWRVTSLGDRIGAVVFSDDGAVTVKPQARDAGATAVINAVAELNRALPGRIAGHATPGALNDALRRAAPFLKHDGLLCLITDAAGADQETVERVTALTAHNDVLSVFVYDPLEADLPPIGPVVVAEANRQMEIDLSSTDLRTRFAQDFARRRRQIERFSRKRSIPVLPIRADFDPIDQLRDLLGRRVTHSIRGRAPEAVRS